MFVVCGEALMDVFLAGETAVGVAMDAHVGGSPLNLAVGLARLGQTVNFYGGVARDPLGERIVRKLASEDVGLGSVVRLDAPTTLSLIGLDAQGVPAYSFYGHGAADRLPGVDSLRGLPAATRLYHFGSYATVVEPFAATLRQLVERERARGEAGALIGYDPNIRLNVEPDLAIWRRHFEWMLPRCDLLKISDEDLAHLYPGADQASLARHCLDQGVRLLVITRGAAGAAAWTPGASAEVGAPLVELVDTVGAGDTFQAALLTWLSEGGLLARPALAALDAERLREALGFCARAAAITCSRRGPDMPRRAELIA